MVNTLRLGQSYRIELPSNPTTGYSWSYTIEGDRNCISVYDDYVPGYNPNGVVGRGGRSIIHGVGLEPGSCTLILWYSRPWEDNGIPPSDAKYYHFEVI
jgi:inhibitor of cysteine peptidase